MAATTHYAEIKVYAHETPAAASVVRPRDAVADLPAHDRPTGAGVRDRGAPACRSHRGGDARGRLSENEQALEPASIRRQEGEIAGAVERARSAEARAADALRTADEERRPSDVTRPFGHGPGRGRPAGGRPARRRSATGARTVTAPAIDASPARRAPWRAWPTGSRPGGPAPVVEPHVWRLGERARSRSGGWEGRIAAIEKGGTRATLEAGGMRVSVSVDDLELAVSMPGRATPSGDDGGDVGVRGRGSAPRGREEGSGISTLRLARARSVASSLDLRGARVDEALDALGRYLDDASLAGLEQVLIIHGLGTGALRDAVRAQTSSHPLVKSFRAGERGEGGDGATIVSL